MSVNATNQILNIVDKSQFLEVPQTICRNRNSFSSNMFFSSSNSCETAYKFSKCYRVTLDRRGVALK